jgi:hypothetical protein
VGAWTVTAQTAPTPEACAGTTQVESLLRQSEPIKPIAARSVFVVTAGRHDGAIIFQR